MISDVCDRGACETCFDDEIDACGHECHGPLDGVAAESSTGGRHVHDPAAGFPRAGRGARATHPPGLRGRPGTVSPDAVPGPRDRETGPVPAGRPSLPGPAMEPARPGVKPPPPVSGVCSRDGGGTAPGRGRVKTPAGAGLDADSATPAGLQQIAARMSEDRGPDSLDAYVRKVIKDLGLVGFHVEKSLDVDKGRKNVSVKGWPDWTIRGPRGVLFRELKQQGKNPTPEQQEWLDALTADGSDAGVWRPMDRLTGRIARELTAISRLAGAVAWTA